MHRILQNYVWLYFMKDKLIVSSSPHLRRNTSTQKIMLDVIIAMIPAAIASIVFFGYWAAITLAVAIASCVLSELQGDSGVFGITDPRTDWEW